MRHCGLHFCSLFSYFFYLEQIWCEQYAEAGKVLLYMWRTETFIHTAAFNMFLEDIFSAVKQASWLLSCPDKQLCRCFLIMEQRHKFEQPNRFCQKCTNILQLVVVYSNIHCNCTTTVMWNGRYTLEENATIRRIYLLIFSKTHVVVGTKDCTCVKLALLLIMQKINDNVISRKPFQTFKCL